MSKLSITALVPSLALHCLAASGLLLDATVSPMSRFEDAPIMIGFGPEQSGAPAAGITPLPNDQADPLPIGWGWAELRCDRHDKNRVANCQWTKESGAGYGDAAVRQVVDNPERYGLQFREGPVNLYVTVCVFMCPVF